MGGATDEHAYAEERKARRDVQTFVENRGERQSFIHLLHRFLDREYVFQPGLFRIPAQSFPEYVAVFFRLSPVLDQSQRRALEYGSPERRCARAAGNYRRNRMGTGGLAEKSDIFGIASE